MPADIEHALIWTRLPILPPDLPVSIRPRVHQDGLWGFTGSDEPPPSPSTLPSALPALADWGVTSLDHLVISPKGTPEEEELVRKAGDEIATFVKRRWNESEWETAWFVNPPVRGLLSLCADVCAYRLCIAAIAKRSRSITHPRLR